MTGRLKPVQCQQFGKDCTRTSAWGVNGFSEGSCAAYYQYGGVRPIAECEETVA